ncbi:MAG: chemotaxis protein CheW [Planctomycetota bacterium]|nr:chemotaxis protein CheW [Planctomycetota bacterium]
MNAVSLFLLVKAGAWVCAIPIRHVLETMRPLEVSSLRETADYLLGLAMIRGKPTPVVSLDALLEKSGQAPHGRFVSLTIDQQRVALGVQEVMGVFPIDLAAFERLPPLLEGADERFEAVGAKDRRLLAVLKPMKLLSEQDWNALRAARA